jgi:ribonuclease VapC
MVIDSSALLAIVFQEPEARRMAEAIASAPVRRMSAVNWLESLLVVEARHGGESADATLLLIRDLDIEAVPFDLEQMHEARCAWQRFGKGRHPAALNLGDCCAYAAAITSGEPLLYKGEYFQKTDVDQAPW